MARNDRSARTARKDHAARMLAALRSSLHLATDPRNVVGALVESVWVGAHVVAYPLGHIGQRTLHERAATYSVAHLTPEQRGLLVNNVEAAGTPILLLHGLVDNRSIFAVLRRGLARRGFGRIETMNYPILTRDIRVAAARLGQEVDRIVAETGYERIHIVGHSMGGLIARYYVTRLGGDEFVHTLVTLGTPHQGTYAAYWWPSALLTQLRPGSALIKEMQRPIEGCRTRFICYWSHLDYAIIPPENAALHHPDLNVHNIELFGVGHLSLPIVGTVVHGISTALAHLDEHGDTVGATVTPIRQRAKSAPTPRSVRARERATERAAEPRRRRARGRH